METLKYPPPPHPPPEIPPDYVPPPPPPVVVTTQPTAFVVPPPVYRDYLAWSIVNLLLCCLPLGAVALHYSIKTRKAINHLDEDTIFHYSSSALKWNRIATLLGVLLNIAWIGYKTYVNVTGDYSYYNG
ncbi:hypothetical protein GDO81_014603 [Engystomops pustulosus]|uniref:Interferon-induced transmembrane protein n=1 Tax=Engystomops pustulosus TaxID=76066 RepID=A0AAV7BBJ8_ENGPU|nr:hypothetical protein GDO81_014603 [Engystomops pustulosus]